MFNLLITARSFSYASNHALDEFNSFPDLFIEKPEHDLAFNELEMSMLVPNKDAIIVGTDRITAQVISKANKLKYITKHGVGVDNVDISAATEAGIMVTNMPGINDRAVADMTMGLIISLSRGICQTSSQIKLGNWDKILSHDVFGKTLGIIGTGNIGIEVIKRARGFDMQILAYDVFPVPEKTSIYDFQYVDLNELLRLSDVVSIHVPLNADTNNLIAKPELAKMKSSALLINTSRASIINEMDLLNALSDRTIAGAALDVYPKEFPEYSQLYKLDNLIVTPHIAAYTYETLEKMDMMLVEAYRYILRGELPHNINILNPEVQRMRSGELKLKP